MYSKTYVQEQPLGPMFSLALSCPVSSPVSSAELPRGLEFSAQLQLTLPLNTLPGGSCSPRRARHRGWGYTWSSKDMLALLRKASLGLTGDGGIQSHHVDIPLFTAGWHRKRRRCASGERNSTWTLLRYTSRGGGTGPTKVGFWVTIGGHGLTKVHRQAKGGRCLLRTFEADPTNHPAESAETPQGQAFGP